ncbi:MAG: hypothetical protein JRC68_02760 [Deltaproteobacteria bacterium]|nr:hypothetical protein [Deltaproteobacteria bacterium]
MKIYEGQGLIPPQTNKGNHKTGAKESDFKKIMDQVSSQPGQKEAIANKENIGPVEGGIRILQGVEEIQGPLNVGEKNKVVKVLQETLDLVDFYSARLDDKSLPAKGMTPLISHLEDRLETLRTMESAPGMPEKLRPILSDLTITIGTEIAKFKRGDYY